MDVAFSEEEFRFQPKTKKKSRGHESIRIGHKTRMDDTLASIFGRMKSNPIYEIPSPSITRES